MSLKLKLDKARKRKEKLQSMVQKGIKKHRKKIQKAKQLVNQGKVIKQRLDKVQEEPKDNPKKQVGLSYRKNSTRQLHAIIGDTGMEKFHRDINKYHGMAKQANHMLQKHDKFVREITKGRGIHIPTFEHLTPTGLSSSMGTQGNFGTYREPWGNQIF